MTFVSCNTLLATDFLRGDSVKVCRAHNRERARDVERRHILNDQNGLSVIEVEVKYYMYIHISTGPNAMGENSEIVTKGAY
jgi:hypothetical protein